MLTFVKLRLVVFAFFTYFKIVTVFTFRTNIVFNIIIVVRVSVKTRYILNFKGSIVALKYISDKTAAGNDDGKLENAVIIQERHPGSQ